MSVTSETAKRTLARNIAHRLEVLGWSRYRLAKQTKLSLPTIINICDGINEPSVSKLKTIADALGVTTDDLLRESLKKIRVPA